MTEMTIEQRREELARQQKALQDQEAQLAQEAREQARLNALNAQQEADRKRAAKFESFLVPIRASIAVIRPSLLFTLDVSNFSVLKEVLIEEGQPTERVSVFNERVSIDKRDTYGMGEVFDITFGSYGNKSRFPQKKDGSHSYDKIAVELVKRYDENVRKSQEYIRAQSQRSEEHRALSHNEPLAKLLREQFNLKEYSYTPYNTTVKPSTKEGHVLVYVIPSPMVLTPERAAELLKLLDDNGFIERT